MGQFLQAVTAASSVGLGCGTCCGSSVGVLLSGYLLTHAGGWKQAWKGVGWFYLGKIASVVLLCAAASLAGRQLMDESGAVAGVRVRPLVNAAMLCAGLWFLAQWVRERRRQANPCRTCGHCGDKKTNRKPSGKTSPSRTPSAGWNAEKQEKPRAIFLLGLGAGYGLTPCAPLLMVAGYAAAMPMGYAALTGGVFTLATAVSPMLFLLLLSGTLAGQIRKDIPQYLSWFRLACYLGLVVCCSAEFFHSPC